MPDYTVMNKLRQIFDAICNDYHLGNFGPIVMHFILKEPEKAEQCFNKIKRIVNS